MSNIKTIIRKIMAKNIITEELVAAELKKLGYGELDYGDDSVRKKVCEEYGIEITDQWSDNCNWFIYEESTADGYSVYVSTHDTNKININEDVFYYDSELSDCVISAFENSYDCATIYISDPHEDYVSDAMYQMFTDLSQKAEKDIINDLIEQGYAED